MADEAFVAAEHSRTLDEVTVARRIVLAHPVTIVRRIVVARRTVAGMSTSRTHQ